MHDTATLLTDPERLSALRDLGLLDRDPEPALQRLTRLASRLVEAPVSLVSLVDEDRQFFAAEVGLGQPWATERETPLSHSFCQHVVTSGTSLVVSNAPEDPRVRDNLAIRDLGIMAYAGVPLSSAEGQHLGSFCVIDDQPREWTERELDLLQELAAAAMTEIELRATAAALDRAMSRIRTLQGLVPVCSWCRRIRDDKGFWDSLEGFLETHTGASISHGICPDCADEVT